MFAAVVASEEEMIALFARRPELKRYLFLYISGNSSRLLTRVGDRTATFDVRRAFTTHQLLTILRDACHTIIFIEHDPILFDAAGGGVTAAVGQTMAEVAAGSLVILYTRVPDRSFGALAAYADRIITLAPEQNRTLEQTGKPVKRRKKGGPESSQSTLEVF